MPKLYLGLRLANAETIQWSDDNVTYANLVLPAGTVWLSPYHAVVDLRTKLQAAGMTNYTLLVMTGSSDALTIKAVPAGPTGVGLKFAAATQINAWLGSPGNVWRAGGAVQIYLSTVGVVPIEHVVQAGWRERSIQRYVGGVAVRGDGSGEALTQAVGLEVLAGIRLRVAIANLADYCTGMTTAMTGAPICIWYENLVNGGAIPPTYDTQQHIGGWLSAGETAIALTPEFDLTDYWAHQFQLRVTEVADA